MPHPEEETYATTGTVSTGAKAGIAIGAVLVVAIALISTWIVLRRRRRGRTAMGTNTILSGSIVDGKPELEGGSVVEQFDYQKPELASFGEKHRFEVESRSLAELNSSPTSTRDGTCLNQRYAPFVLRTPVDACYRENGNQPGAMKTAERTSLEATTSLGSTGQATLLSKPQSASRDLEVLRSKQKALQESIEAMEMLHSLQAAQAELHRQIRDAEAKTVSVLTRMELHEMADTGVTPRQ